MNDSLKQNFFIGASFFTFLPLELKTLAMKSQLNVVAGFFTSTNAELYIKFRNDLCNASSVAVQRPFKSAISKAWEVVARAFQVHFILS